MLKCIHAHKTIIIYLTIHVVLCVVLIIQITLNTITHAYKRNTDMRSRKYIVWGVGCKHIVWGVRCKHIVWGVGCKHIVWGVGCKHIVWGVGCKHIVWGVGCKHIVWGVGCKHIVWGVGCKHIVWGVGCKHIVCVHYNPLAPFVAQPIIRTGKRGE